ncbi:inosine-5-monophosphate dehydrogenase [Devosia riboflavina]|uniref:Inosine-5-monophosphate dehydrogenase n=1 Tax=Devosia riboflavina TaxID=46914 RepID=A0A087M4V4_9HYPH|nr:CBS domain-containing protein [Devosia riboflavina]KFL31907.1 inosine-5-monophosphate dehydrogenase [Devosia riboflavina]
MIVDTILQLKGTAVYTLRDSDTLGDAVAMLNSHNIGAIVIVGMGESVIGILSERDIVRQLGNNPSAALAKSIGSVMTRAVVTCDRTTAISDVMERMTHRRIRHMPVVDGDRLTGIISIGDVVKLKIEEVEHEAEVLREYIAS